VGDLDQPTGQDVYAVLDEMSEHLGDIAEQLRILNETMAKVVSFEGQPASSLGTLFDHAISSLAQPRGRGKK